MPQAARTAALVLFIAFVFNMLGRGVGDSFMVFVLPLSEHFGWQRAQVSSVYSAFLVITGVSAPLTGMLIDRWGPRLVYPLGLAVLGSACLLASRLTSLWQFQLCIGVLGGIGVSMLGMVPASMLISRWFRERMATAMGVAYAGFGTGTLIVVPVAQRSIELEGWRATYQTMGIATLLLIPLVAFLPWARIMGDSHRQKSGAPRVSGFTLLREAMRTRPYWQIVTLFSFTSLTTFSVITQVVPFFIQVGLTPLEAAGAFGGAGMISVVGIMAAGWAGDRFGFRRTVTGSFVATFLGISSLMVLSFVPMKALVFGFIICFGIAMGARGPIVSSLAAGHFRGAGFATIYGTMFAWMSASGAVGAFIAGLLYDVTGGYRAGFVFSIICLLIAVSPFWVSRPLDRGQTT